VGKNFNLISGMPRTGSTLLSSILNQNENIRSEGFSPVCRVCWDINEIFSSSVCHDEFLSANKDIDKIKKETILSFIYKYYNLSEEQFIFDKSVSWLLPANQNLAKFIFGENVKTIVLERPFVEVVESYINILEKNNIEINYENIFLNTPLLRSVAGVICSNLFPSKNFLRISYSDIVFDTEKTIENIYDFFEIKKYNHDYNNIRCIYPENEKYMGISGINQINKKIIKKDYFVKISKELEVVIKEICYYIDLSKNISNESDRENCLLFVKELIF
jgi:sulfotransferase